jgi:hypothetical protein
MNTENISPIIDDQSAKLGWIIGNLIFTSMVVIIAFLQMYVYYQHPIKAKNICFGTFFVVLIGLLLVTKNIPLSILSAIIVSNLIVTCGNLDIFTDNKLEKELVTVNQKVDNVDKKVTNINEQLKEKNDSSASEPMSEPVSEPESKKPKEKYLTGSNFQPYLTSGPNDLAYPSPPNSLKFQN